jgi:hypothetical protein
MAMYKDFSCLTMLPHIRNGLLLPCLPEKCLKVFLCFNLLTLCWLITCLADPRANWTPFKDGPRMRHGVNPQTKESQDFYFPDDHPTMPGWFKGMEQIIQERDLWPETGLRAECPSFKCPEDQTNCCCRRLLFNQADFISQKSQLEELIVSRGHICDFYPKYHCELNFIEQYWGASKLRFRLAGRASTINQLVQNVKASLDDVPLDQIRR